MLLGEAISRCVTLISLNLQLFNNRIGEIGAKNLGEAIS